MPPTEAPHSEHDRERPAHIGRFVVEGVLGVGGMGVVYAARDTRLDRAVAIKALSDRWLDDPRVRARFEREAKLAAALNHPNVAAIYGVEEQDGATFLVFERVDGETLTQRLARGTISVSEALALCGQIATGVAAAHRRGVVHRDLKPDNVKITPDGVVKVLDFGIGKRVDIAGREPSVDATEAGSVLGTFGYMSPEQVRGEPVDERTDVWALGCILFECLSGKKAFGARNYADAIAAVLVGEPDFDQLPRAMPARVRAALKSALAKDARERPANAGEFAALLPGGVALQAAIAAGETPTPEMVAAAGEVGAVSMRTSLVWFVVALAAIVLNVLFKNRVELTAQLPMERPPAVLVDRARSLLERLELPRDAYDVRSMWATNEATWSWIAHELPDEQRRVVVSNGRPTPLVYWYRESPHSLAPLGLDLTDDRGDVTRSNPPFDAPGMALVELDTRGRLVGLSRVPFPSEFPPQGSFDPSTWSELFTDAGLELEDFEPTSPAAMPSVHCTDLVAWVARDAEPSGARVHVEAGAIGGHVAFFEVDARWVAPTTMPTRAPGDPTVLPFLVLQVGAACLLGFLARRHVRIGTADVGGATRVAMWALVSGMLGFAFEADHVVDARSQLHMVLTELGYVGLGASLLFVLYLAMEPYVRRQWPWRTVSWNRLVSGRARDPMVGRDVLIGCAGGAIASTLSFAQSAGELHFGLLPNVHATAISLLNDELRFVLARPLLMQLEMLLRVFGFFGAYCVIHRATRSIVATRALVFVLLFLVQGLPYEPDPSWRAILRLTLVFTIWILLAERLGVLAVLAGTLVFGLLYEAPSIGAGPAWASDEAVLYLALPIALMAGAAWTAARRGGERRTAVG